MKNIGTCDLCGLSITPPPVVQTFEGEEKHFCCHGCLRVYQVAFESGMLDQVIAWSQPRQPKLKDIHFKGGETVYFTLGGMYCAGCAVAAENVIRNHPGIQSVDVSFAAERGRIQYDPEQVNPEKILKDLDRLGYQAQYLTDVNEQRTEKHQERILLQLIVALAFGMQVMLLYFVRLYPLYAAGQFMDTEVRNVQYLVWLLTTPILIYGGNSFLQGAWRALRARTATMDTLVALGTLSAYGYSSYIALTGRGEVYFDSVSMITTFVMIGRYLETIGGARARKDVRILLSLQPDNAWKRDGETWQSVEASSLMPGDTILVKPGERVPADAEIIEGVADLDEALLTGESLPVPRQPGDKIFAGTVVTDDALVCHVLRATKTTRLAQIAKLVEQTLSAKPPIQRLADRASAFFAVGILGTAAITFLGWWSAGLTPDAALLRAVAVLVVACPCALGLATPLALTVTLGRATRQGVLVRNPAAIEAVSHINRIVFDKTGTLTRGQLSVTETVVDPRTGMDVQELLCLAAAVEQFSEHPVARAILETCAGSPLPRASEFQSLRGLGVSANVGENVGQRVMVGSSRFLDHRSQNDLEAQAQVYAGRGEMVVWIGWDDRVAGFSALRDEPNQTAQDALQQLKEDGIRSVMLSGDSQLATRIIASDLGLDDYAGDCIPNEKAERIRQWQSEGERVAMVGDGVNDAPALAQADLSITVAGGTDVAGETSDVLLTRSDLALIPWFIQLARRTRRIIWQNLGWAFAYNLATIPLAAFGIISPVIAAATMATSSLLVTGNSLRLRR